MAVRPSTSRRRCARPDRGTDSRLLIPGPSCIPALSSIAPEHTHNILVRTDPPRTSRPDTALDLAIAEPTARAAARTLVAVVTNSHIPLAEVRTRLELRRPRRYLRPLTDALKLMAEGVQSALGGFLRSAQQEVADEFDRLFER